jgi:hypothetical protein
VSTKLINLLPREEKKRDVRSVVLNVFMVIVIILLLAVVLLSVFIFDIDNSLSVRLSEYENVNMKLQDQVSKLKVYNDFNSQVNNKKDVISGLKKDAIIWSKIIYDIGNFMPEGASINIFDAQGSRLYEYIEEYKDGKAKEGENIIAFGIIGEALEYTDVLRLVIELKKIENIKLVWIQNISNINIPELDSEIIRYSINAYWNLEPFLEDIKKEPEKTEEEDVLDSELDQLES